MTYTSIYQVIFNLKCWSEYKNTKDVTPGVYSLIVEMVNYAIFKKKESDEGRENRDSGPLHYTIINSCHTNVTHAIKSHVHYVSTLFMCRLESGLMFVL